MNPFFFTYTSAFFGLLCFAYSILIVYEKKDNSLVKYFSRLLFFAGSWSFSNVIADLSSTQNGILFWSGMAVLTYAFYVSEFLNFTCEFIEYDQFFGRYISMFNYVVAIILSFFGFTKFCYYKPVVTYITPALVSVGPMAVISNIIFYGIFLFCYVLIIKNFRSLNFVQKYQALYIMFGSMGTLVGAIVFTVILPLYGNANYYSTGPTFNLFLIIGVSLAIFKYDLFDIRFYVQKYFIYTIFSTIFFVMFFSVLFFLPTLIKLPENNNLYIICSLITTLIGILIFPKLELTFKNLTDKWFYKGVHDYTQAISEISEAMNANLNFNDLKKIFENVLKKHLRSEGVKLLALDDGKLSFVPVLEFQLKLANNHSIKLLVGKKLSDESYIHSDFQFLKFFLNQAPPAIEKSFLVGGIENYSHYLRRIINDNVLEISRIKKNQNQLIVDMSHSLQTPITVLKSALSLAKPSFNQSITSILDKTIDEISKKIYDLARLAKMRTNEEEFNFEKVDLSELLESICEYVLVLCNTQNIQFFTSIEHNVLIWGDRKKIEEMVNNFISNSIKNISNQRIISLTIKGGFLVELKIKDSGIGIPESLIPQIFLRRPGLYFGQGWGVGLPINKSIVDRHGGSIEVISNVLEGTEFIIRLPCYS